jgi:hypothetical protein
MMMTKRYSAQALAIVMIVLVISIVLGMAMMSRVLKDNLQSVDEKSSAEALETSDAIFDAVKGTSVAQLKTICQNPQYGGTDLSNGGVCKAEGASEVNAFLQQAGVVSDATESLNNCQDGTSTIEFNAKLATKDDELEIRSDTVRSFLLKGQVPNPATCTLNLTVEPRGSAVSGFLISKIYGRNYVGGVASEYKPYAISDMLPYCVYTSGSDCSSNPNLLDTWTPVLSGSRISIPLTSSGGYALDEIRLRGVSSVVSVKAELSNPNCITNWEMVKMVVGANCTGSYRAKEVQIPQKESALSIFDYVLFNGTGTLTAQ